MRIGRYTFLAFFLANSAFSQGLPEAADGLVDASIAPLVRSVPTLDGAGNAVAASRDAEGGQSDFVVGVVVLRPRSPDDLVEFLSTYGGVVLRTDEVTVAALKALDAPPEARPLPAERYTIRVDLGRVRSESLDGPMQDVASRGGLRFSSDGGLRTFALALEARQTGYRVMPNYLVYPQQAYPRAMFQTQERPGTDGFTVRQFGFQNDKSKSNVIAAWQFVSAHGITRPVRVAIIDNGFLLRADGAAANVDTDFPAPPARPLQWDHVAGTASAGGANPSPCGKNPCPWHGTGSTGVAVGIMGNGMGVAGAGAMVGIPILIRMSPDDFIGPIRTAIAAGADVISMSFGHPCDYGCRESSDDDDLPFADHVGAGGKTIFVAAAGNLGRQVSDVPGWYRPCTLAHITCVGALDSGAKSKISYSNYGDRVDVFAPTNIPVMSYPPASNPFGPEAPQTFGGTSAATPLVAGVAAMMKAINPQLNTDQVNQILRATAQPGIGDALRTIDALAAVRRAAEGIPIVPDHLAGGLRDFGPLVGQAVESDLNIDAKKKQGFGFAAMTATSVEIDLDFPADLGEVSIGKFEALNDDCPPETQYGPSKAARPLAGDAGGTKQRVTYRYRVAGGSYRFTVSGSGINAYNLRIRPAPGVIGPDAFERNDDFISARRLNDPENRVAIDASLHTVPGGFSPDRDFYILRAAGGGFGLVSLGGEVTSYSAVQILRNESPIVLDVYQRNPDGSLGQQIASGRHAPACTSMLSVSLTPGGEYYVVVSGEPGTYALQSGTFFDVRRLNYFNLEDVISRPGPVEIPTDDRFFLPVDGELNAVVSDNPRLHLRIVDPATGLALTEAVPFDRGERLDLSGLGRTGSYLLEVRRLDRDPDRPVLRLIGDRPAE